MTAYLSSIVKKAIMAISGIALGLFILVHLAGNSTAFFGKEAFLSYAAHLHSLGVLIHIFEVSLLSLLLVHLFFGISLFLENFKSRPERYYKINNAGGRTLGSRTMPYSGAVILLFIIVHLKSFHFTTHALPITEVVRQNLQQPIMAGFYILSLIALTLHISHGFWSVFQTLGLNHPRYNQVLRIGTLGISLFIGIVFILIPVLAIFSKNFLS